MAKSSAVAGPRPALIVRFMGLGPQLEGSRASCVFTDKVGRHCGWTVTETPNGVELEKGTKQYFVPWSQVAFIERADG